MTIKFYKYEGTGNDFVIIDNRNDMLTITKNQIKSICDRRFGIGGDGLMILEESKGYDFLMKYYNSNGIEGSMCGNGGRCMVTFSQHIGLIERNANFIAIDGEHYAEIIEDNGKQSIVSLKIKNIEVVNTKPLGYELDTGSPHLICFREKINEIDVFLEGQSIRYNDEYKIDGINVNFVELISEDNLFVRTYERGVEDETLACGTGATASAIAASIKNNNGITEYNIKTKGGKLKVSFKRTKNVFSDIYLEGPATYVFNGSIQIS